MSKLMRKLSSNFPLLFLALFFLLLLSVSSINASTDELTLKAPDACPAGGCAAGQRLNLQVDFSIDPQYLEGPNTQICVYVPDDGQSGIGSEPWADFSNTWISASGLITHEDYTMGEAAIICTEPDNIDAGDLLITSAYAQLPTGTNSDQLEFALNINRSTDIDNGVIKVKVFEADTNGSWDSIPVVHSKLIPVSEITSTVYVAQTSVNCSNFSPCFINSGDDEAGGLGTGLRDAIMALSEGDVILILEDYAIKNNTVQIDKDLTIQGHEGAKIIYADDVCINPMLRFTAGGLLKDLTLDGGDCLATSRDLVTIDSPDPVTIEHNTLNSGKIAVNIFDNDGDVTVAFNHIADNTNYAVFRAPGDGLGQVNLYANNFINNRNDIQVACNNHGAADHNYWGNGGTLTSSTSLCGDNDAKRLGAPILLSANGSGVRAIQTTVTDTGTYYFSEQIGLSHAPGDDDFDVIIVNHGQGEKSNIPFYSTGAGGIQACSNFYDVFLADNAAPSNLDISLKYNLNKYCISTIESEFYCLHDPNARPPLWWYDPRDIATNGWDRTDQKTVCNMNDKEIRVTIDGDGHPDILEDLGFTPFVVGFEGINLSEFTAVLDVTEVDLKWITTSENNVRGYSVLRSTSESGTYARISTEIDAIGDSDTGGIYHYTDSTIAFAKTYYYKFQVIDNQGNIINLHGPASVLTSTATPTSTHTLTPTITRTPYPTYTPYKSRTPYPTRTAYMSWYDYQTQTAKSADYVSPTPYYYRSPTPAYYRTPTRSYYQSPTPKGGPTQVRTYGPTPTGSLIPGTQFPLTTPELKRSPTPGNDQAALTGYPVPGFDQVTTPTASPESETGSDVKITLTPTVETGAQGDQPSQDPEVFRWFFLLIGAASGLSLLGAASILLAKKIFS